MYAKIHTECGAFTVEFFEAQAPVTCAYFAQLIASGALDQTSFYRIVGPENGCDTNEHPIVVIQGGLKDSDPQAVSITAHETTAQTGLRHLRGTLSTARFYPLQSYGSFFICMRDEPALDYGGGRHPDGQGFAAFAAIGEGFDVVENIYNRIEDDEYLQHPVLIHSVALHTECPT